MATGESALSEVKPLNEPLEMLESRLRNDIRQEYETRFEVWKAKDLAALAEKQDALVQKAVAEYMQKLEEERKPLTKEQIQQLLDQEYNTFPIKLRVNGEMQEFTIGELPQKAEKRFYMKFKEQLTAKASVVAALAQQTMDRPLEEKIKAFLETFDGAFEILAEAVVIVLNYDGSKKEITKDWVQENLNSNRMWNIVQAQMEVNKLRDFFSQVSLSGLKTQSLMTGLNAQNLPLLQAR